jgi:DNA mismatch repair protein MutH
VRSYDEVRWALDPFVGVPFRELADALGTAWSLEAASRKALAGELVETLLRIARNSIPEADLAELGTEVKSLPLNHLSRPRERTKVTSLNYAEVAAERHFFASRVFHKLRTTLFVPIQKTDNDDPTYWYLRPPFVWLPSTEQLERMEANYLHVRDAVRTRRWEAIRGSPGEYLTVSTSGARSKGLPEPKTRAWYLKTALTREVCRQHLWPQEQLRRERSQPTQTALAAEEQLGFEL